MSQNLKHTLNQYFVKNTILEENQILTNLSNLKTLFESIFRKINNEIINLRTNKSLRKNLSTLQTLQKDSEKKPLIY